MGPDWGLTQIDAYTPHLSRWGVKPWEIDLLDVEQWRHFKGEIDRELGRSSG